MALYWLEKWTLTIDKMEIISETFLINVMKMYQETEVKYFWKRRKTLSTRSWIQRILVYSNSISFSSILCHFHLFQHQLTTLGVKLTTKTDQIQNFNQCNSTKCNQNFNQFTDMAASMLPESGKKLEDKIYFIFYFFLTSLVKQWNPYVMSNRFGNFFGC